MKKLLPFLFLLFPTLAFATPSTQYVTIGCGNNGDGTSASCAASAGAAGAFNTLGNWESQNLTLTTALNVVCSGTGTSAITIAGWTTSAANTITLTGCSIVTSDYNAVVSLQNDYVNISGGTWGKSSGTVKVQVFELNSTAAHVTIEKATIYNASGVTRDSGNACLQIASVASGVRTIRNNIVYGCKQDGINYSTANGETANVYNNTVYGVTGAGIAMAVDANTATWNVKNNLASNNTGGDYSISPGGSTTYNHATNLSSDTTSPDASFRSKTVTFINTGGNNYHLNATDTEAKNLGTDLSGSFTDDIDGDTRSGSWDIGADEVAAGGGTDDLVLLEDG